jgi:hypothetical protein
MNTTASHSLRHSLTIVAAAALFAACSNDAPLAPTREAMIPAQLGAVASRETAGVIGTLRGATARYHDLDAAIADGFVFLHECENRPGEGPVGIVYVHLGRLMDGVIDPELPDALIYEPGRDDRPKLVGVEFAIPYPLWTAQAPPEFLGATFQSEDEFGVFGLHVWVWRNNPDGLFAESNPNVSCGVE